jgi:hypothetical protein
MIYKGGMIKMKQFAKIMFVAILMMGSGYAGARIALVNYAPQVYAPLAESPRMEVEHINFVPPVAVRQGLWLPE